jgi:predicted amidohydrolase YtcJ
MQSGTFNRSIRFLLAARRRQPVKNGASLAIVNANVITMDDQDSLAQAIAISDDRILKVGSENEIRSLIGEATQVIDLDGRTVVPGFINAHDHTILGGVGPAFSVGYCRSIKEMLDRIAGYARQVPKGELIQCDKVDPVFPRFGSLHIKEQRWPTREELDVVTPDHHLILGLNHGAIVNSKLLDLVLAEGPSNIGGIVKDPNTGEPNGILTEAEPPLVGASRVVRGLIQEHWPTPMTDEMLEEHDIAFAEQAVSVGFTTVHIAGSDEFQTRFLLSHTLAARFVPYFDILDYFSKLQPDIDDENLERNLTLIRNLSKEHNARIGAKFLNDGDIVPPDNTGALFEPYINQPANRGILYLAGEDLRRVVSKVHEAGLQLAIHCCGGRCVEEVLDAYEYALKKAPRADHRHRIEHGELVTDAQIERASRLGIAFVMSPIFLIYDDCAPFLGEERMRRLHRNKSLMEAGVLLACGSDWGDVIATDPFLGIHIMVNHQNPEERISVRDALRAYTINGAKVGFEEKEKGSLEPGKLADLVVLSDDIYKVDPKKIRNLQVALTMVGGKIVFIDDRLFRNYP